MKRRRPEFGPGIFPLSSIHLLTLTSFQTCSTFFNSRTSLNRFRVWLASSSRSISLKSRFYGYPLDCLALSRNEFAGAYSNRRNAPSQLSGFLADVQHAATYAPYCDAFFTDRFMADLLNDPAVAVEQRFGCKI